MPWPEAGETACAASPMITIEALCQTGTSGRSDWPGRREAGGGGPHDPRPGRLVGLQQPDQPLAQLIGGELAQLVSWDLGAAGRVGEPPDLAVRADGVAEEAVLSPHHDVVAGPGAGL